MTSKKQSKYQPTWKIENIVASVSLFVEIPLEPLSKKLETAEYNPEQFPGLIYKMQTIPHTTTLIFSSGKLVCTGAKNMKQIEKMVEEVKDVIKRVDSIVTKKPVIEIQNMVASGALGHDVNLETIAFSIENSEYEPEQFPGLVYRMINPRVAILLFGTGRIVVAGAKTPDQIEDAIWKLAAQLKKLGQLPQEYPDRE